MNQINNGNLIAFSPGYYIKEYLIDQGMKQNELADLLNTNEKTVGLLINGKIDLNDELIVGLSSALGTSQQLWKKLNQQYLQTKAEIKMHL